MIQVRAFDAFAGLLRQGEEFLEAGLLVPLFEGGMPLAQGFDDDAGHVLAGLGGDGPGQTVGFWVFDAEAHSRNFVRILPGLRAAILVAKSTKPAAGFFVGLTLPVVVGLRAVGE
jgi:hypothetical protein